MAVALRAILTEGMRPLTTRLHLSSPCNQITGRNLQVGYPRVLLVEIMNGENDIMLINFNLKSTLIGHAHRGEIYHPRTAQLGRGRAGLPGPKAVFGCVREAVPVDACHHGTPNSFL
jgi:hypothetical protein